LYPLAHLMYDSATRNGDFSEIKEVHRALFDFLVEKGFIVEDRIDELQRVKDMVEAIDNDDRVFELHINPTMNCNFNCWYCYETHIKESKMDEATFQNVILFIAKLLEEKKGGVERFSLGWFGGEPLLFYKKLVVPILQQAFRLCSRHGVTFHSSITTNGLLVDDHLIETAKGLKLNFFQITLDGNRQRHDTVRYVSETRGSYRAIVANIKALVKRGYEVLVRINCSPDTLAGLFDIMEDFADLSAEDRRLFSFSFHKVWQDGKGVSDETLYAVRSHYRRNGFLVDPSYSDIVAGSCYGDHRNHAVINYNGEMFKCTARDFTTGNSEGTLNRDGAIVWNPKYERRMDSKFKNKPCLECGIMPICNGGCSQQALEHEGIDYCVHDFDEDRKRGVVVQRFLETIEEF